MPSGETHFVLVAQKTNSLASVSYLIRWIFKSPYRFVGESVDRKDPSSIENDNLNPANYELNASPEYLYSDELDDHSGAK